MSFDQGQNAMLTTSFSQPNRGNESASHAKTPCPKPKASLGKDCGTCTLCCTTRQVDDLGKASGQTCQKSTLKSCSVWGLHPKVCQDYSCLWLKHTKLGDEWRPDKAGFVLSLEADNIVRIDPDPQRPFNWQRAPYYEQLKLWSQSIMSGEGRVVVHLGNQICILTPDEDLWLSLPKKGETIETSVHETLFGLKVAITIKPAPKPKASHKPRHVLWEEAWHKAA
jgi:hypothetical protein